MNNWIERNIIFPRISQLQAELQRQSNDNHLFPTTARHVKPRKKNSLNLYEGGPQCKRKNLSTHIRNIDEHKQKFSGRRLPYLQQAQSEDIGQETCKAVKRHITILDKLEERKKMFHSNSPKSIANKLKLHRQGLSNKSCKAAEVVNPLVFKLQNQMKDKKSARAKGKTEPIEPIVFTQRQSGIQEQGNDCLKIKKAKNFDYNTLTKEGQAERESIRKRELKGGKYTKRDDRSRMVDSIRGWNQQDDRLIEYSYAW